jgi:hypothetical protein
MKTFVLITLVSLSVLAQENPAMLAIGQISSKLPADLSPSMLAIISFLISEIGLRLYPTAKPKSMFLLGAMILKGLSDLLSKLSGLFDKIGQNLKEDPNGPSNPS